MVWFPQGQLAGCLTGVTPRHFTDDIHLWLDEPNAEDSLFLNGDLNVVTGLGASLFKPMTLQPNLGRDLAKPTVTSRLNFKPP